MKLIYGTNIWTHHQIPLATELARIFGVSQFRMALFEAVHEERCIMGWGDREEHAWVLGPPRNQAEMRMLVHEFLDADVAVVGACPREVLEARVATGKLTFYASERMLKKRFHHLRMLNPRYAYGIRRFRSVANQPNVHALAVGHYAPDDLKTIDSFNNRIWKWGYFVDIPSYLPEVPPKRPLKLLWCGRMLKWKRVDLLLKAVGKLKKSGCIGECLIVGDGPERQTLHTLARKLDLASEIVRFAPSVPFAEVRRLMRAADVYVLPSNRHEGWGAVAGEAMAEGCILVANEGAGASKDLVWDGETGLLFCDGDVDHLAGQLKRLALDYPARIRMRRAAWDQMQSLWHPRVAAERLVALCNGLLGNSRMPEFTTGPCSKVLDDNNGEQS